MRVSFSILLLLALFTLPAAAQDAAQAAADGPADGLSDRIAAGATHTSAATTGARVACNGGAASGFGCRNVDLLSFLPIQQMGGSAVTELNDIWGWTDPETGREYAVVGRSDGTSFVDVSDPENPVYLGNMPTHSAPSLWRDVKVYENYALVVAEDGGHGLQLFDLTKLRNPGQTPATFTDYVHFGGFGNAHNIVVNEETGFAYAVGTRNCGGGLYMIDVRDPQNPAFAGCYAATGTGRRGTGYTHDAQCVIYSGPDAAYQGREICFGYNETAIVITDVTDKGSPVTISTATYPTARYVHQGWLTEDQRFVYQDDELDESSRTLTLDRTRTMIWDVSDLDDPVLVKEHAGVSTSIDHNQYIVGDLNYQANYTSGLRILDVSDPANPEEVGFFDTFVQNDRATSPSGGGLYEGAWSNYPFFESGVVVVSSIGEGLFVLMPTNEAARLVTREEEPLPSAFAVESAYPNPFNPATSVRLAVDARQHVRLAVFDVLGREVALLHDGTLDAGHHTFAFDADGRPSGRYFVRAVGELTSDSYAITLAR